MRRMANSIVHALRDQVRGVRYSIRAEAQVPGSSSSIAQQALDFPPLAMVGSMFGTPALRLADGLFTQVEHVASDLMHKVERRTEATFPCPIADFLPHGNMPERLDFAATAHRELSRMLAEHGARNMLVSEHALDNAWAQVLARHGDRLGLSATRSQSGDPIVLACASLAVEVAKARPIQRMDLIKDAGDGPRHLMLAPNVYCGLVLGLAVAIVSTKPAEMTGDRAAIMESADSTVDARFDRLKQAIDSRSGAQALADVFRQLLPYLP